MKYQLTTISISIGTTDDGQYYTSVMRQDDGTPITLAVTGASHIPTHQEASDIALRDAHQIIDEIEFTEPTSL